MSMYIHFLLSNMQIKSYQQYCNIIINKAVKNEDTITCHENRRYGHAAFIKILLILGG